MIPLSLNILDPWIPMNHDHAAKREKGLQDFLQELCPKDKEGKGKHKNRSSVNKNKYAKRKKIKNKSYNKAKALMQ